jgi:glucosamine--fructose-6-phosphate aminotransferase (isomerizing)
VIYLEDDDMVYIDQRGKFHFYRSEDRGTRSSQEVRELTTLEQGLSQFSKGNFAHFMLKEIFEQEESVINTCRGRLRHDHNAIQLGGLSSHIESIKRCRRIIFCACGTSYNSAMAVSTHLTSCTR